MATAQPIKSSTDVQRVREALTTNRDRALFELGINLAFRGGDLLTLSTVAASPAITWARLEDGLRPARSVHAEVGIDRTVASGSHFGALLFAEHTNDALLTLFEGGVPLVSNFGTLDARGFGVTVGHRFGGATSGSLTYTFGQGRRAGRRCRHRVRVCSSPQRRRVGLSR